MTTAITTTTATPVVITCASPFNDPSFFSETIDSELHRPAAARLSEPARRILRTLAAPGGLGGGITFSVIEVVAGLKLRTTDPELGSIYREVVSFLCRVCRLNEEQAQMVPVGSAEQYLKYFDSLPTDQDAADKEMQEFLAAGAETHDSDDAAVAAHDEANPLFGGPAVDGTEPTLEAEHDFVDLSPIPGAERTIIFDIPPGKDVSDAVLMELLEASTNNP